MLIMTISLLRIPVAKRVFPPSTLAFISSSSSSSSAGKPTSAFYDRLIDKAANSDDFSAVGRLLVQRFKDGCYSTINTFRFVSKFNPDSPKLDNLVHSIAQLENGYPKKNSFDCLIAHLCKSMKIEKALDVVFAMQDSGARPNFDTFQPIISILSRKKKINEAMEVLKKMREKGCKPDVNCYNHVVAALCHLGKAAEAAELVKTAIGEGLRPNSMTYDALILGACKQGRIDGAIKMLRRMEEEEQKVLYRSPALIIRELVKIGGFVEAIEFVKIIAGRNRDFDCKNFGFLARCLVRKHTSEMVSVVLKEMEERGLPVDDELRKSSCDLLPE